MNITFLERSDLPTKDYKKISDLVKKVIALPEAIYLFEKLYQTSLNLLREKGKTPYSILCCMNKKRILSGVHPPTNGYLGISYCNYHDRDQLEILIREQGKRIRVRLRRKIGALVDSQIKKRGLRAFLEQTILTKRTEEVSKEIFTLQPYTLLVRSNKNPEQIYY